MIDSSAPIRILLLEDSEFDADLIGEHLDRIRTPISVTRAHGRDDFISALSTGVFDVILCDFSLPGYDGLSALRHAREAAPDTPFIFVSGVLGEDTAIASFNEGATDYVLKQRLVRLPAAVERAVAEAREKTERRRAEEQTRLLVAELSHRVKNTLAMVMSVARRTARSAASVDEYERMLVSRLRALSDAHALIFEANWQDTDLHQVVERTLAPMRREGERQFRIEGPFVSVNPKAALSLSLIFHELAANAVRYGALVSDSGSVDIDWSTVQQEHGQRVRLVWREEGGPPVTPPGAKGFGMSLLERSLDHELDGKAEMRFEPAGLVCEMQFTL